ncbi:MAG TPA: hypothetical protein QGF58_30240 [Myxococcota bacterium]|nr:hypothetical protein [Myxococcota bacterium]
MARNPFNPESLATITHAFAKKQTGIVSSSAVMGGGVMFEGEPLTEEAGDFIIQCLMAEMKFMESALRFQRGEGERTFGPKLWSELQVLKDPSRLAGEEVVLADNTNSRFAGRFPVHPDTRIILNSPRDGHSPLAWMFDTEQIDVTIVRDELSILAALDFFDVKHISEVMDDGDAHRTNEHVVAHKQLMREVFAELTELRRGGVNRNVSIARLEEEWTLVRQADEWVAVGVRADAPPDVAEAACAEIERRYAKLQYDNSLSSEAREIIRKIHLKNTGSVALVRRAQKNRGFFMRAKEAYDEGLRNITVGAWSAAVRSLNMARKANPMNPMILANLGWALYHDDTKPPAERREAARQLLVDAEAISDNQAEPSLMLARIDRMEGFRKQAEERLMMVLRKDRANEAARQLLHEIRSS